MKRFTLILALMLMVAMPMMAERVTPETARKAATTFLSNNGAKAAQLTDLSKAAGFNNLYIFTAEQGFVVMAADDCVQPILGYSLTGKFVAEDMPENMIWWLQGYNDEIQSAVENKTKPTVETAKLWKELVEGNSKVAKATVVVAPLIQTKWNQNKYYNSLCPAVSDGPDGHAYTGCVATAMAQVMKYWSYPAHGIGSHSYSWNGQTLSADFGATNYDWANMADAYEYYYVNGTDQYANWLPEPSVEEIAAVATLMYHCGVSVDMSYGGSSTGGSAAPNAYVATALKNYFNYSSAIEYKEKSRTNTSTNPWVTTTYYTDAEWISMLKTELDASRPMQYGGSDPNGYSGHAFVCDGYDNSNYFHFNWGWAGHYNGYFTISNLNTGANSSEAGAGNGTYTRDQDAIFGIKPASMTPAPSNLAYTINGLQDITLTWDAVNGVSSYNVYRDGNLISNTTETTYSEVAPFGTFTYYVRCVDANGQLSLGSNTVTVTIAYQTPIVGDLTGTLSGSNVSLSWSAPEWCYPEEPLAMLTYGNGSFNSMSSTAFWAHRYLANDIAQYSGKVVYKISFYAYEAGSYILYIYNGSTSTTYSGDNIFFPETLITEKSVEVTSTSNWIEIDLDDLVAIDGQEDLWIIMNYPNGVSGQYPAISSNYTGSNNHGNYWGKWNYGYGGGRRGFVQEEGIAYLIRTYLTDGTYTYNLYQDGNSIAQNLNQTTYNANLNNNAANLFTVKTNFSGIETEASNKISFAKGNVSLASLNLDANDKMTITEGSKLTVSGTLSNENAANLILENGAQLVNSSDGVQATVKKNIEGYSANYDAETNNNNADYYIIASPITESITPTIENGLLTNSYDLYTFDQSEAAEWRNYEVQSFDINNKVGYLYASSDETTLTFTGTLANTATATTLDYNGDARFKGFNLIGNPFPCEAYINRSFYVLKEDGSDFTVGSNPIPPCAAILVQAQDAYDSSVTFSKTASKNNPSIVAQLKTADTKGSNIIDQARVNFNENDNLAKYSLDENASSLYFPQEGNDFAAVSFAGQSEMPLNFKVKRNGSYTLSFELENAEVDYLHLIDNLTGNDIDLLTNKSYTFEANVNDYASRFRLVFANCEDAVDDNETFAYINNGNIIVNQEGTLQIVDMTGRVVASRSGRIQCVPTSGMTSGVYVLRLINGDNVKTQKIVVQ
jgi:hypothetical protein